MTRHRIHLLLPLAVLACNQPEAAPYPDEPNAASSSRSSPAATSSSAPATPSGPQAQLADMDHRTPVPLQPMMAWHQKQNMMDHLVAIQRITDGLARDDWDAVAEASKLIESSPQMQQMCQHMGAGAEGFTKRERLSLERERNKLTLSLGGIREMGGVPDLLFVIDTNKEDLAVLEARKLGIPVIAVLDSNSSPEGIDYPIPGNDDAARAISLYCDLVARAAISGMTAQMGSAGIDVGGLDEAPEEEVTDAPEAPAAEPAETPEAKASAET